VLRYHGGKWKLASWVMQHFPPHRGYVEPFGGAASVLMKKPRVYAEVYNELDGEVVNVFRVLQDPVTAARLEELVRLTPFARAEFLVAYHPTDDPVERARRTLIKSFMGFGSSAIHGRSRGMRTAATVYTTPATGFRANSERSGTTPAHDWARWPATIPAFVERLQGVVIESRDALEVMRTHDRSDVLHYVDPPYPRITRSKQRKRKSEYLFELTDDDHRALAKVLHGLRGFVVLSGYRCDLYDELYATWTTAETNALADGARPRRECLWLSPRTADALCGRLLLEVGA
jgi:DNA adenine methylase